MDLFFNNIQSLLASNFPVLRMIHGTDRWARLVREFYAEHLCRTPLFPEVAREFLRYLQDERGARAAAARGAADDRRAPARADRPDPWASDPFVDELFPEPVDDRARELAERGLEMSEQNGFNFWIGWSEVVCAATGSPPPKGLTPAEYARKGLDDWEEVGSRLGLTYLLSLTVELLAEEGNKPGAEDILSQAEAFMDETGEKFWAPEIVRLKGVLRRRSAPKSAEGLFRRAIKEADDMGARLLALRALLSLAETPGWREEARLQIKERLLAFPADEDCADLRAARAFVAQAGEGMIA